MCNCHGRCALAKIGWVLVIIGGINWGLVGAGMLMQKNWDVVGMLLGRWPTLLAIVYLVVGIATLFALFGCPCGKCKGAKMGCMGCKVGMDKPMSGGATGSGM